MRTILFIVQKEFIQVFRNRTMLPIIFAVPVIQMIILVNAATLEMKNIRLCVVDNDLSSSSNQMLSKFVGSPFFKVTKSTFSFKEAENELKKGKTDVVLVINNGFEKNLGKQGNASVLLVVDAINGVKAGLIYAYSNMIINSYNKEIILKTNYLPPGSVVSRNIEVTNQHWFNPELNYSSFMVPGILVILVTMIGLILSGLNIVREKETGTIEQINVTPVSKIHFMIGKLLPFWILALVELAFGLALGKLIFNIPIVGSLWTVFAFAAVYLITILAMGLIVSTFANIQQQAMFIIFFFMIIFIMMGGLFTSVDNIPLWAQYFNKINPIMYFVKVMRMILLKGSGFADLIPEFISLLVLGFVFMSMAVWRYRKTA